MATKTNAMRLLDSAKIGYAVAEYDSHILTADGVAQALGVPVEVVFKTLVMLPDSGPPILCMVPGGREVDLRALAAAVHQKSIRMASKYDAERLTGLQTGGIGALALTGKRFSVYLDDAALEHERIYVNAGKRGCNVYVRVDNLIAVTRATLVRTDHSVTDQVAG